MSVHRRARRLITAGMVAMAALVALVAGCGRAPGDPPAIRDARDPEPVRTSSVFPLRIEPGQRYLLTADGRPFFVQGDAAWSLIAQLTREQIVEYLDDRQRRGFNTVIVNLVEHEFATNVPANIYGEPPFGDNEDFSTPNEAYFAHAEFALIEAEKRGILVLLAPAYLGYEGRSQGWYQEMEEQDLEGLRSYGHFVARRFANRRNIIWVQGGDFVPPDFDSTLAVAEGIHEVAPTAMQTFHGARNSSAFGILPTRPAWLTLNNVYTSDDNVVPSALAEHARSTVPFILIEAQYEDLGVDALGTRRQAYQAVLSGACGHLLGHDHIWRFNAGWQGALESSSSRTLATLPRLLDWLHWPQLEPVKDGRLVVSGAGQGGSAVASSRSPDRRQAVIYVPERRPITVDVDQIAGSAVRARWFDPATGDISDVPGAAFAHGAPQTIAPPASATDPDWVLLLEGTG